MGMPSKRIPKPPKDRAIGIVHQNERVIPMGEIERLTDAFRKLSDSTSIRPMITTENLTYHKVGGGFYKANERCCGCGAPMLTNGKSFECEFCGGGIIEK